MSDKGRVTCRLARTGLLCLLACLTASPARAQVMTTSGDFSVDPSGTAHFEVPILVPPGTAGMVPSLSLAYSSNAPNAIAGVGWSIEGLSTIGRCPKNIPQDGLREAVDYDNGDPLCLDGQRLVKVSGTHQSTTARYRTEIDGLSRIAVTDGDGNGPLRFEVRTKAGLIMTYGDLPSAPMGARLPAPAAPGVTRLWAISRVEDTAGNYMTFKYLNDAANGDYRPDRIDYGGNARSPAVAPYASVRFVYESRPDPLRQYSAGGPATTLKRLSRIQSYVGADLVTEYRLSYQATPSPATGASQLAGLARCDGGGVCLPPVTFTWSGTAPAASTLAATATGWTSDNPLEAFLQFGDVDGDGLPDGVKFRPSSGALNVYRNTGALGFTALPAATLVSGGDPQSRDFFLVDLNLDGRADAVHYNKDNGDGNGLISVKLAGAGGSFSAAPLTSLFRSAKGLPGDGEVYFLDFNDYDDDGYPDAFLTIVRYAGSTAIPPYGSWIAHGLGNGQFAAAQVVDWTLANHQITGYAAATGGAMNNFYNTIVDSVVSSDLNHDGLIDKSVYLRTVHRRRFSPTNPDEGSSSIYYFREYRCINTYLRTKSGTFKYILAQDSQILTTDAAVNIKVCPDDLGAPGTAPALPAGSISRVRPAGDLNGDGNEDHFVYYKDDNDIRSTNISLLYGTGDGKLIAGPGTINANNSTTDFEHSDFFFFSDVNGDGLSDFVIVYTEDDREGDVDIHYARPDGSYQVVATPMAFTGNGPNAWVETIDLDGDGVEEIVTHQEDGQAKVWRQPGAPPDRLAAVTDGLGATVQVSYDSLVDPAVYTKDSNAAYPRLDVIGPIPVVSAVATSDGLIDTNGLPTLRHTLYRYGGLEAEVNGRSGLLGFRWRETTQVEAASLVREEFSQSWPYVGMTTLRRTQVKPGVGYLTVNAVSTSYRCIDTATAAGTACVLPPPPALPAPPVATYFPYAWKTEEATTELNGTALPLVTTTTSYDRWGNALVVNTGSADGFSKRTVSTYDNDESKWFLGRLRRTEVTAKSPDLAP